MDFCIDTYELLYLGTLFSEMGILVTSADTHTSRGFLLPSHCSRCVWGPAAELSCFFSVSWISLLVEGFYKLLTFLSQAQRSDHQADSVNAGENTHTHSWGEA